MMKFRVKRCVVTCRITFRFFIAFNVLSQTKKNQLQTDNYNYRNRFFRDRNNRNELRLKRIHNNTQQCTQCRSIFRYQFL